MSKFRKKPVVIEAIQLTGFDNMDEFEVFFGEMKSWTTADDGLFLSTLEGNMYASIGDWIIKGVKGEFYPCKPDIFAATYEPVGEAL